MKINWRVRLRNKVWVTAMLATLCAFVFDVLALLDVVPAITQEMVMQALSSMLTLLSALGVIIDPTTAGAADSDRAMTYTSPN